MEVKDFLDLISSDAWRKEVVFRDKNNNPLDIKLSSLEHPHKAIIVVEGEAMDEFLAQEKYIEELIEENTSLSTALYEVSEAIDGF